MRSNSENRLPVLTPPLEGRNRTEEEVKEAQRSRVGFPPSRDLTALWGIRQLASSSSKPQAGVRLRRDPIFVLLSSSPLLAWATVLACKGLRWPMALGRVGKGDKAGRYRICWMPILHHFFPVVVCRSSLALCGAKSQEKIIRNVHHQPNPTAHRCSQES